MDTWHLTAIVKDKQLINASFSMLTVHNYIVSIVFHSSIWVVIHQFRTNELEIWKINHILHHTGLQTARKTSTQFDHLCSNTDNQTKAKRNTCILFQTELNKQRPEMDTRCFHYLRSPAIRQLNNVFLYQRQCSI